MLLAQELERATQFQKSSVAAAPNLQLRSVFAQMVAPRETIFNFSAPRTLLTENPQEQLQSLFATYVERQMIETGNGPEEHLRRRMQDWLRQSNLSRFYREEELGNETYAVKFPFVASDPARPQQALKAIKPLNLAQDKSGDVLQHGDDWLARVRRLNRMGELPAQLLFAVKQPPIGSPQQRAAQEICEALDEFVGVSTFDFGAKTQILEWASLGELTNFRS